MIPIPIPPIPYLDMVRGRSMHLLLAHLCDDTTYRDFYLRERERGAYLILDNSAHEFGKGEAIRSVFLRGARLAAQEIVIPDVLFDANATVARAQEAFAFLQGGGAPSIAYRPNVMVVPQGDTFKNLLWCLDTLIGTYRAARVRSGFVEDRFGDLTIGVSKDYEEWDISFPEIILEHVLPRAEQVGAQVHLLGWGRKAQNLAVIAHEAGDRIRSVDSAKPFVYAIAGQRIYRDAIPPYPGRPKHYFTWKDEKFAWNTVQDQIVLDMYHNIGTFEMIADPRPAHPTRYPGRNER